jgi:hypothetical protein
MRATKPTVVYLLAALGFVAGCGESSGEVAQKRLSEDHLPRIEAIIEGDLAKHREAIATAAERLAPGFAVEDAAARERQMRAALRALQKPPHGVSAFLASPMTFLAAIDTSGVVIARDAEPDLMKGMDLRSPYPIVEEALSAGRSGYALVEFPSTEEGGESSVSILFVAPAKVDGATVGAVALGIPLWSLGRRIHRQLEVELQPEFQRGAVVWVYFYRGDRLFHQGTPPDLDEAVPSAAARTEGLRKSRSGYTDEVTVLGRSYGFAVRPTPAIADDVGVVVIRGEP